MKFLKLKNSILFVVTITIISGISGFIYNTQIVPSWFLKYQIDMTPEVKVYANALDTGVAKLDIGFSSTGPVIIWAQQRISKQKLVKDERIKNFVIKPDTIAFTLTGTDSTNNIENEVKQIISRLNKELKSELSELLDLYTQTAVEFLEIKKEIGLEQIKETIKFYEDRNFSNSEISARALDIIMFYLTKYNVSDTEQTFFQNLQYSLQEFEKFNVKVNMDLLFNRLENLKPERNVELIMIDRMKNNILSTKIYTYVKNIEKVNIKPKPIVSIISFSIFGFFLSILVLISTRLLTKNYRKYIFSILKNKF